MMDYLVAAVLADLVQVIPSGGMESDAGLATLGADASASFDADVSYGFEADAVTASASADVASTFDADREC